MGTFRQAVLLFCAVSFLFFQASDAFSRERFYRIILGDRPSSEEQARDRLIYGAEILYTGDCKNLKEPLVVPGIIWHENTQWAHCFRGSRNPVLEQDPIFKTIENSKWEEAKLLLKHVPDLMPRTENMADILGELKFNLKNPQALNRLSDVLKKRYPGGFFLKPNEGFNSDGTFVTQKTDFLRSYRIYRRDVRPLKKKLMQEHEDETSVHSELKGVAGYEGRVLELLLENPSGVIIQERVDAVLHRLGPEEYRVHVVEGKVLHGATQQRWEDFKNTTLQGIADAEAFVTSLLARLPENLQRVCMGMDIIRTKTGQFKIIELNPGGESGYLYPEEDLWITQVLAEYYSGEPTSLQKEWQRVETAESPHERFERLNAFLALPGITPLVQAQKPITTYLARAKDLLFADYVGAMKRNDRKAATFALQSIRRARLSAYLNRQDNQTLKNSCKGALKFSEE